MLIQQVWSLQNRHMHIVSCYVQMNASIRLLVCVLLYQYYHVIAIRKE